MIYYNQFTGEKRYVEDSPLNAPPFLPIYHSNAKREGLSLPFGEKGFAFFDYFKKMLPEKFALGHIHPENLNFNYIISHLQTDDILLGGIILLLITDSAETNIPLILALVFMLVSEWIFDDADNSLLPI